MQAVSEPAIALINRVRVLDPQCAFATGDTGHTRTHHLDDDHRIQRQQEGIKFVAGTGQLDGIGPVGDVDETTAKNIRNPVPYFWVWSIGWTDPPQVW